MSRRDGLALLIATLCSGARIVGRRRLRGGLGAVMHIVRYEDPFGERSNVIVRSYITKWPNSTPQRARYEFDVLGLVAKAGISGPRPLLLDAEGEYLGAPTLVLSYLPGRSYFPARQPSWTEGLAAGLAAVHAVTPQNYDLSWLQPVESVAEELASNSERVAEGEPLLRGIVDVLEAAAGEVSPVSPCLIHDDYWPGNTVWYRGRLAGIVDWTQAGLGDPRADIAQCRADLVFSHGPELADAFLHAYEVQTGRAVSDMWYFDLLRGLRALIHYRHWLLGYIDAGLTHLDEETVGGRLRAFVNRAMAMAASRH